jgi:hypothetical protein
MLRNVFTSRACLTLVLRLLLTGTFVPVLFNVMIMGPAIATQARSAGGLPASMLVAAAIPPLGVLSVLIAVAWLSLRLWNSEKWPAAGMAVALLAFAAVWTPTFLPG